MLWSAAYPYVLPEVTGAPDALLDQHLRTAAITLCERTQLWQVDLDPVALAAGRAVYDVLPPDSQADVAAIRYLWVNGIRLTPTTSDKLSAGISDWRLRTAPQPSNFLQFDQDTVTLYPCPSEAAPGAMLITAALRPSLTSTGLPDWIMRKYVQELAMGAKSSLTGMTNAPWADLQASATYGQMFQAALTTAEVELNRGLGRGEVQIRMRRV